MLVGRLAVDSPRDRGQRAQQLRWRKAANPGQPGPGFSAADIGDRRWRPDLDRRARIGGAADGLGLILRLVVAPCTSSLAHARFAPVAVLAICDKTDPGGNPTTIP